MSFPERLAALRQRYAEEPTSSADLLIELQSLVDALDPEPDAPGQMAELARLGAMLMLEQRDPKRAEPLLTRALRNQDLPPAVRAELNCFMARADIQQQRYDVARQRLAEVEPSEIPLVQALHLAACAQLAHREGEMARSEALAAAALQRFSTLQWPGPWVQVFATRTIALAQLGQVEARAAVLAEGMRHCMAQRRWGEAANLASGLFDQAVDRGDLAQARQMLRQIEDIAARELGGEHDVGKAMLRFSSARLRAAEGSYAEACVDLREALNRQRHRLVAYDYAFRLNQLADWLLKSGQMQQALEVAAEAQQIQQDELQRSRQRDLARLREALAVQHAEREQQASEAHARRMEAQQAELERTLDRQRALHEELVEARKLAGLGQLLVGLARALDLPLRDALAEVAQAKRTSGALLEGVVSGAAMTRRQLLDGAQAAAGCCQQAQARVESSIVEIDAFRGLRHEA